MAVSLNIPVFTPELLKNTDPDTQKLLSEAAVLTISASNSLTIVDDSQLNECVKMMSNTTKLKKSLEDRRTSLVKPLNDTVKTINGIFKKWTEPLDKAEKMLKTAITGYRQEQEKKRQEEEKLARKKQAILQKIADKKALAAVETGEENVLPPIVVVDTPPESLPSKVRTESGASYTARKVWNFEVVNQDLVPREYMVIDTAKIRSAVRAGTREIPGVHIYQEENIASR